MKPRGPTATKSSARIRPSVTVSPRNSAAAQSSPSLSCCPLCSCIRTSSGAPLRFYRGVYGRTFAAGSEDRRGFRVTNVIAGFGRVTLPNPARVSTAPERRLVSTAPERRLVSTLRAFAGPGLSAFQLLPFHYRPAAHEAPLPAAVGFYALAASDDLLKCLQAASLRSAAG